MAERTNVIMHMRRDGDPARDAASAATAALDDTIIDIATRFGPLATQAALVTQAMNAGLGGGEPLKGATIALFDTAAAVLRDPAAALAIARAGDTEGGRA
jgi:hypothetical protein